MILASKFQGVTVAASIQTYEHMQFVSWVNAHTGQNSKLYIIQVPMGTYMYLGHYINIYNDAEL